MRCETTAASLFLNRQITNSQNHDLFIIMIIMIVLTAMITILVPQLHFAQNELLEEFWTTSDWVEKMMFEKKDSRT